MTKLTVQQVLDQVIDQFGDEANIQVTSTKLVRWFNAAQREIAMQHDNLLWKAVALNSTAGDSKIDLPTDLVTLLKVDYLDSSTSIYYPLRYLNSKSSDEQIPGYPLDLQGTPEFYAMGSKADTGDINKFIQLFPIPDTTLTSAVRITYNRYPVAVVNLTDTSDLPEYYDNAILEYCLMKAYEMDEDWAASDKKAAYVQSTIDFNNSREAWFGRQTYPVVNTSSEDYYS